MSNNEVKSHCDDNKVANKSKDNTYTKRTGAAGAEGHFLEISLLTLCKLRGDQQLKDFYLAGNLESAGDFDDIVFRYVDDSDRKNVLFLQSKFRQNANHKITIKTFETDGDWPLQKYYKSFTEIQDKFNECSSNDRIFEGKTENLNCHFVIYTNANRHDDMKEHVAEVENPINFVLGEKHGHAFKLRVDKAKQLLQGGQHDLEIEQVIKLLKQIHTPKCKNLHRDENFKMYHAFFTQTIFVKDGEYWKYRNDFLESNSQNEVLKTFRDKTFSWYAKQIMGVKKSAIREDNTIKHMKDLRLDLPAWFENAMPKVNNALCDEFITIALQCISDSICTIAIMRQKLLKVVSKFVGNVLMFDEGKGMFTLNEKSLDGAPREILDYLTKQLNRHNMDQKFYFDIQVENFPRLSLGFTRIDSEKIGEFADKFTILSGQPDVQGIRRIIQTNFGDVGEMETARYYQIIGKMTDWWKQLEKVEYLRKDDGFMDGILSGMVFNVMDPLPSFTGRTEELEQLHAALQNEKVDNRTAVISQMATVCGLGGIGKTQLARQYVHEYGHNYGSLIWIDAETQDSMGNCFRRLCKDCLKIPTQDANKMEMEMKSIVQEVYGFFKNRKSLFVFDNAQYFKNDVTEIDGIQNFLPSAQICLKNTHFLLTSRNQNWSTAVKINLDVFKDVEAVKLVKCSLGINDNQPDDEVKDFVTALHNFPLAIQQGITYIKQTARNFKHFGKQFEISDYLKQFSDKTKQLLDFKFPRECDDIYTKTTFTTWNITLSEIEKAELGREAMEIIAIIAYLNPNDILVEFFAEIVDYSEDKLIHVFAMIEGYSMIKLHEGKASVHRLVQSVTRISLQGEKQQVILKKALGLIRNHTDFKLTIHGASVWNYAKQDHNLVKEFHTIPAKVIAALNDTLRYEEAFIFGNKSLMSLQCVLQADHPSILETQNYIAKTRSNQGKYEEALCLFKELHQKKIKVLGPDNPSTIATQHYFAQTLWMQGKYDEALCSYTGVLSKQMKVLMPDHPSTLTTQNSFARTLSDQGKYEEALSHYEAVLQKRIKLLGPEHQDTLITEHNIAKTLAIQGKYEETLCSFNAVVVKLIKIVGPGHPCTLIAKCNVAELLSCQGKYEEALCSYEKILEKQKIILGSEHPLTLSTEFNVAQTLYQQGKYKEAQSLNKDVLKKMTKTLGPEHPYTLEAEHFSGVTQHKNGNCEEGTCSLKEVLRKKTQMWGPDHPSTLVTKISLAETLSNQGKFEEALCFYKEVLENQVKIFGPEHPNALSTQSNIAKTMSSQGKYEESLCSFRYVIEKQIKMLGPEHPDTLTTQQGIATTLYRQGMYEAALHCYKDVLEKRIKILGPEHLYTLTTQQGIATTLYRQGMYEAALCSYREVLEKLIKILGPGHPDILDTQSSVAIILFSQGKHEEALSCYRDVLQKQIKILGPEDPGTLTTEHSVATILSNQGKYGAALISYEQVFEKQIKIFGRVHPFTLITLYNILRIMSIQKK